MSSKPQLWASSFHRLSQPAPHSYSKNKHRLRNSIVGAAYDRALFLESTKYALEPTAPLEILNSRDKKGAKVADFLDDLQRKSLFAVMARHVH